MKPNFKFKRLYLLVVLTDHVHFHQETNLILVGKSHFSFLQIVYIVKQIAMIIICLQKYNNPLGVFHNM